MRRTPPLDHLAHSLTDLMVSLMVIFILLMIVFIGNQRTEAQRRALLSPGEEMRQNLAGAGFSAADVRVNPADPHVVTVQMPSQVRFRRNESRLSPEAEHILNRQMPRLAEVVCGDRFRDRIESFTIEGYADGSVFRGLSPDESRMRNLELSQNRSREVARRSLDILSSDPAKANCVSERVEASGRGTNAALSTSGASRRVVFRIRLDPAAAAAIKETAGARTEQKTSPAVTKMLALFDSLRTAPTPFRFELSEAEVNEYLQYALTTRPRFGIRSTVLKFGNQNQISARVEVSEEALDYLPGIGRLFTDRVLGGRNVDLTVRLHVSDATMTYSVVAARIGSMQVPERLVREAIRITGARQPERYDTEAPIPLPFGLHFLEIHEGRLLGGK